MSTNSDPSPAPVHRLVGRIPRCPGCKYSPKIKAIPYNGTYLFRVEQKGFWMDSCVVGPAKYTSEDALKAWKRMLKKMIYPPNVRDDLAGANPHRQAENNHAAGSSPSTCWADAQSEKGTP